MELEPWLAHFGWDTAARVIHLDWTRDRGLLVEMDAYPFWLAQPSLTDRKRLTIRLANILASSIDLDWDEIEIGNMSVSTDDPLLWHYGQFATIYATSPVADPTAFLAAYLNKCVELGVVRDCLQYLNAEHGIEGWLEIVRSSSYALLSAPIKICEAVEELLGRQRAQFSILPGPARSHKWAQLAVWIDNSWVVCESAEVHAEGG